ncbi:helix-turn-helix domain-containing protein, partial [Candidatus Parcubacteria bacterium]|nr:helix-turn-helix domain-containing protein [Candidatus Parcubacteria bacterium]
MEKNLKEGRDLGSQEKIGYFIRNLREERGLTQDAFARELGTSQSAVARMEAGKQNFSTQELMKVSRIFNRKIVAISESLDFEVKGGRKLEGSIVTNFSKNGSVVLLCASLLNRGKTTLHGISRIEEVNRLIEIMGSLGVSVRWVGRNSVEIAPPEAFDMGKLDRAAAARIRSSLMLIGPLAHHLPRF